MPATQPGSANTTGPVTGQVMPTSVPQVPALHVPPTHPVKATIYTTRRRWLWGGASFVAVALLALLYFQPWVAKTSFAKIETVTLGQVTRVLAVNGRIAAVRSVALRPSVVGTVQLVAVAEGDIVTPGALLLQIDASTQQAVVTQAKAGMDAALVAEEETLATLSRTKTLGANASRSALDAASRSEQSALQEVVRMTALVDQAMLHLKDYTVVAPASGTVLAMTLSAGQIVDTSTALMTIADMSQLVVETDVDEAYATEVQTGQTAALQLSGESTVREGHVSFVSQQVNTSTGGLAVKLAFDGAVIAPVGLTVTANIIVDSRPAALSIPRTALVITTKGADVFVLAGGVAKRRAVEVIDWPATRLIVTSGLTQGDLVIADATGMSEGLAVTGLAQR